jgi:hypothetical protein
MDKKCLSGILQIQSFQKFKKSIRLTDIKKYKRSLKALCKNLEKWKQLYKFLESKVSKINVL